MGASNSTPRIGLPQWADNDRPTWRGDMNNALADIDDFAGQLRDDTDTVRVDADGLRTDVDNIANGTKPIPYVPAVTLNLPNPCFIAHRGGAGYAPEETMAAFRTSVAAGADAIEMDLQPLADGSLGLMHDPTVDRTTDGTGNVSSFTAPAWLALNAAAKFAWNGKSEPPAMLTQIVGELGNQVVMMIEPKDNANAVQLINTLNAKNLRANTIVGTSYSDVAVTAHNAGYKVYFYFGTESVATTAAITSMLPNVDYFGFDGLAFSDAKISEFVATGKPCMPYTINRRVNRDRLLALGVKGFVSDNPIYLRSNTAQRTVDSWRQGVFGHGLNVTPDGHASVPAGSGALALYPTAANAAIPGEVCPLANKAGTYTIDIDVAFTTLPADLTRAISVSFGIADDGLYAHSGGANSYPDEYRAYLRANGQISLYRVNAGNGTSFTQLGSTLSGSAMVAGQYAHLRISVTPTTVRFQRTDGTAVDTGPINNTDLRGGYLTLSKNALDAEARFKNLAIT